MRRGQPLLPTTIPRPPRRARPSPRQLEYLAAYVRLGSSKAVAHELGVAHRTAKHMLFDDIHARLGVSSTTQAVWACRRLLEGRV